MKFPSVQTLAQATLKTCKRFPLTIFFTLIACYYSIRLSHTAYLLYDAPETHYYYTNIIWAAWLGMLLSLIVVIYSERNHLTASINWLAGIITIILVAAFYFSLPDHFSEGRLKQFILFMVGLHLMVAFIPYTEKGDVIGFWQYNKTLFLRFLAAALYSLVLYIGLSLALLAVDKLFSVDIKYKWYLDLWICIAEGFSAIFFLAGFPADFEKPETSQDYPKGLKIFTQYVLLPIITVYLLILYAYMIKILGTRQWPYGWVSYLVLAFAITGILSLLLIHPIRNEAQNKWIPGFNRFFYFAICPLIILLFLAIERRISDYGITEGRYIVLGLSYWLAFVTLYFIFSKKKNIKTIPISLCLIALLISFGPWGAFSVSFRSQNNRLSRLLRSNHMLSEDYKIIPATAGLHKGDAAQITSIVEYLVKAHGYRSMQPYFTRNLDSMMKDETGRGINYTYKQSENLIAYMKVDEYGDEQNSERKIYFNMNALKEDSLMTLSGYEYLINKYEIKENTDTDYLSDNYQHSGIPLQLLFNRNSGKLTMKSGSGSPVIFDLTALVKALKTNKLDVTVEGNDFHQYKLVMNGENKDLSAKVIIKQIDGNSTDDSIKITHLNAGILLHFKLPQPINKK